MRGRRLVRFASCWLAVGASFLSACENDVDEVKALSTKRIAVEKVIKIESYYSQGARMKAKLTAPLMNRYLTDSAYVEFPKTLHVDFFDDSLRIESQLDARYGKYRESEHKVFLRDSVVVFNIKGDTLHCQELWWDQQTQKFYTDKPVRIHQPDKIIYGQGLEAAQNFSSWVILKANGPVTVPNDFNPGMNP